MMVLKTLLWYAKRYVKTAIWSDICSVAVCVCVLDMLIHWGRVTHICASTLTIIGSYNGHRQAIIRTNAGTLLIGHLRTNFSEILIEMYIFSFRKMHLKTSSGNGGHFVSASMCQYRDDCAVDSLLVLYFAHINVSQQEGYARNLHLDK